ncbi:MAG TPA: hypothetical protein VHG28_05620 [Longimicrobiaceae bacterium]|nr:hypothetical protein [Longimicrobiaceae bacterium]
MLTIERTPHPVKDVETARRNRQRICESRGFCGPFLNQDFYAAFPGWDGFGDCIHCGSTRFVPPAASSPGMTAAI